MNAPRVYPLCINCTWHIKSHTDDCVHPVTVNVVTGEPTPYSCYEMRELSDTFRKLHNPKCGIEGRYFKSKDADNEPNIK